MCACRGHESQARAEAARLRRQVRGLRSLASSSEKLFPADQLTIGVKQELVRDLLRAHLPLEKVVGDRFRARLDSAEVLFEGGQSLVLVEGRLNLLDVPDHFADFTASGSLRELNVDERTGLLTGPIELDHIELKSLGTEAMEPGWMRAMMEGLAGRGLGALGEVLPPIEIPLRLDHQIESRGFKDERIAVPPARLPLKVRVKKLVPLSGRLWVMLDVRT